MNEKQPLWPEDDPRNFNDGKRMAPMPDYLPDVALLAEQDEAAGLAGAHGFAPGRFFSTEKSMAEAHGALVYVDIPDEVAVRYAEQGHYVLPDALLAKKRQAAEATDVPPGHTRLWRGENI